MKNYQEFLDKRMTASPYDERLKVFIAEYRNHKSLKKNKNLKILDIGCGTEVELFDHISKDDEYYGCDYYKKPNKKIKNYIQIDLNKDSLSEKLKSQQFDVIFCGEVIEHIFSPDALLEEIRQLMRKDSILILSTPNLSYFVNRIIFLFGISPLFLENSSDVKLGRKYKAFGQGNITEGHIKVFTHTALKELIYMKKYEIKSITPVSIWDKWFDRILMKMSKDFAPDNVFVLTKK